MSEIRSDSAESIKVNLGDRKASSNLYKKFYEENHLYFLLVLFLALAMSGINLFVSWLLAELMDVAVGLSSFSFRQILIVVIFFLAASFGLLWMNAILLPRFVQRAMTNYKNYLLEQLLAKDIASFSAEESSRYLASLSTDALAVQEQYVKSSIRLVTESVTFFGAIFMMLYYSPLMTLVAAVLTALPIAVSSISGSKLLAIEKAISQRNQDFFSTIADFVQGFPLVKNFQAENAILRILSSRNEKLEEEKAKSTRTRMQTTSFGQIAGLTTQLGVTVFAVYLIVNGKGFTPGMALAFVNLMSFVIGPIATVPTTLAERRAAKGLIQKAENLLFSDKEDFANVSLGALEDAIHLRNVHFAYEEGKELFTGLNCTFKKGKSYAIVGVSGSGKSTLLKLVMKEVKPRVGEILYDMIPMQDAFPASIAQEISRIQQNVFLFNASIMDNITMFQDFSEEEIGEAIRKSALSSLIVNKGRDYLCGENGRNLSGGEKQRIAIGRALLKDSSVILLDEATSSLDKENSLAIMKSILDLEKKTRIVVTHNLDEAILRKFDCILFLGDGRVIEQGRFEELLHRDGYFKRFYELQ